MEHRGRERRRLKPSVQKHKDIVSDVLTVATGGAGYAP